MENEKVDNKNNSNIVVVLVVLVAVVGAYLFIGGNNVNDKVSVVSNNVAGVATVNGVEILKTTYDTQLDNAIASYKTKGVDVSDADKLSQIKKEVLDGLINNELLSQSVSVAGIKTSPEEVEKQFQLILNQAGGADALKAELIKNNLTETQLRENIAKQLAIQTYLSQNIDIKSITVSEAEIAQFYADYSKAQKDSGQKTVPELKDLSDQIKQQISSDKQQSLVVNFINTLRAKAKIEMSTI